MCLDWKFVVGGVVVANLVWAAFARYRLVSVQAAYLGVLFVKLKWLAGPTSAVYLFAHGAGTLSLLALIWPLAIFLLGAVPTTQVGRIQTMFMEALGYNRTVAGS
jgi:hypothetical protein